MAERQLLLEVRTNYMVYREAAAMADRQLLLEARDTPGAAPTSSSSSSTKETTPRVGAAVSGMGLWMSLGLPLPPPHVVFVAGWMDDDKQEEARVGSWAAPTIGCCSGNSKEFTPRVVVTAGCMCENKEEDRDRRDGAKDVRPQRQA
eukprot:1100409-Pelagomonas_calceolata.AAC.3